MEVYSAVKNLTPEQEQIALFWADDPGKTFTPPGHSIAIATQILRGQHASLALAAETYARVGLAVGDAFIGCWHAKYVHNLVRPITYIQSFIDPTWNTPNITDPVITPPFPEYPSGHSTQSGATASVLTALFGDEYRFTDNSHAELGLAARTFNSFDEFADEAAISRLYGGIHYRPAIELGVDQGRCIGEQVNKLAWKK
ncbi:MAG: vanadium-dependent haloperoxidase [Caldilineaceae bacterium]|nr:vanadium-dependent haloperoxidase [Caldilineaceae bacterium]